MTPEERNRARKEAQARRWALKAKLEEELADIPDEHDGLGLSEYFSKAGQLERKLLGLMRQHEADGLLPTNGRFMFYEAEMAQWVEKHYADRVSGGDAEVTKALTKLRKLDLIDWDHLTDETRTVHHNWAFDSVAQAAHEYIDSFFLNPWIGSDWGDARPLILCESRSLAGVLQATAQNYRVLIAATNGQCGGFLRTDIAPILEEDERPVLYLGDYDLQGGQIEANTREVLEDIVGPLDWTRVTITKEQIDERGLEPITKTDNRYEPPRKMKAWETEALGQSTVIALVEEALESLLPTPLADTRERQNEQREALVLALEDYIADEEEE